MPADNGLGMTLFAPVPASVMLTEAPRLASWDAAAHPSQQRLTAYLTATERLLMPALTTAPDPLALRLEVGLTRTIDVLREHDLDNYLLPLARHLSMASGRAFSSVTGQK